MGFKFRGTDYCISLLPIGGYVRIKALSDDRIRISGIKKIAVYVSGLIADIVFALTLFTAATMLSGKIVPSQEPYIGMVRNHSPAEKAGLLPGDRILSINKNEIHIWDDIINIIRQSEGKVIKVSCLREGETFTAEIKPMLRMRGGKKVVLIGIAPRTKKVPVGFFTAVETGLNKIYSISQSVLRYIFNIFTKKGYFKEIIGPVSIFKKVYDNIQRGLIPILYIIAYLSIAIGIINMIPIPTFDGGRILFAGIECIFKPIPAKYKLIIDTMGMVFTLVLIILITINDISKL